MLNNHSLYLRSIGSLMRKSTTAIYWLVAATHKRIEWRRNPSVTDVTPPAELITGREFYPALILNNVYTPAPGGFTKIRKTNDRGLSHGREPIAGNINFRDSAYLTCISLVTGLSRLFTYHASSNSVVQGCYVALAVERAVGYSPLV